jgi:transcriptional regulator with AAA-type ATPase domain/predicted ATPase
MDGLQEMVGNSPGIAAVLARIRRLVAHHDRGSRLPPVLVLGETGTGKGLLVRLMHQLSVRREMPLVEINCAAIPDHLVEAELFGFERGAFTDARQSKPGLFQSAHRGVLFLDEVGSLSIAAQAKLLTAIEQREVRRLGSTRAEPVDIWIVSATNEDLEAGAAQGRFRLDLYHRIATVAFSMPPLRERGRDVLLLARHFLDRFSADYGLPPRRLTESAEASLLAHPWPGNVRELANLMERAVLLADSDEIAPESLGLAPAPDRRLEARATAPDPAVERATLQAALDATEWNLSRAAGRLGMPRNTLRYRIERLGLRPQGQRPKERATEAPATSLRWERRRVTALLVALEPPASASVFRLVPLLDELARKVESFGGRLDEVHPLGFTALFGQEPLEDGPVRAALTLQAMQKAIEGGRDVAGGRPRLTAVLHTAETLLARGTTAGGMDRADRQGLRDALAALAESFPGATVVSADVTPFLDRRFVLERLPGGSRVGYRIVASRVTAFDVGDGPRSPFVGRDRELSLLDDLLVEASRGRGHVVGVVGEPGVGKSRLLYEFGRGVHGDRATYLEGRCAAHTSHTPYLPIIHLLHQWCGADADDDPAIIARKIRAAMNETFERAADGLMPYALALLGVEDGAHRLPLHLTPHAVRHRTLDAIRQIVMAASQRRALIVAVEDLQWADPTSADCLSLLADSIAASRVLLLATYRQGHQPAWLGKSYASQLIVRRLSPQDCARIVEATGAAIPRDVVGPLLARADGVPFFLEELVRAVAEHPAGAGPAVMPATVQEVITARVDRLAAADRAVIEAASVLGREGLVSLLRDVSGLDEPDFASALARLRLNEFLRETRVVPAPEYAFHHVLTQEVTYGNLAAERRARLHETVAASMQRDHPHVAERIPELLAHHLTEAGRTEAAIQEWHRAGRLAIERSAHAEAAAHLSRGLALLATGPDHAGRAALEVALQLSLVAALITLRGYAAPEVGEHLARARALAETLGDSRQAFLVRWSLWRFSVSRAEFRAAERLATELLQAPTAQADPTAELNAHFAAGVNAFYVGEFARAYQHLSRSLELYPRARGPEQISLYGQDMGTAAEGFLGWTLAVTGDLDAADEAARHAMEAARRLAHPFSLALVLLAAGEVYQLRRELPTVDGVGRELFQLAGDHGFVLFRAFGLMFRGWARAHRGEGDGLATMQEGANLFRSVRQRTGLAHRAHLAEVLIMQGSLDAGLAVVADGLRQSVDTGEGAFVAELHRLRGEALGRRAQWDHAEASLREALAVATRQGAWLFGLRAATDLVRLGARPARPHPGDLAALRQLLTRFAPTVTSSDLASARSLLGDP